MLQELSLCSISVHLKGEFRAMAMNGNECNAPIPVVACCATGETGS